MRMRKRGQSVQRLGEVLDEVVRMLEPDREADEVFGRARARPFARRAMLDEALDSAERGRADEELRLRDGGDGALAPAVRLERQHPSEARHLAARDLVSRMRFEPGVVHGAHGALPLEEARDDEGARAL